MTVYRVDAANADLEALAELLIDAVESGGLLGYVLPFGKEHARWYWKTTIAAVAAGERVLFCARNAGTLAGSVQLYLSPEPNAPHRAEVFKLLVHRAFRNRGVGSALMAALEEEAARLRRSTLLLDTAMGSDSERLYRRLGWVAAGAVPRHFVDPFGAMRSSVYMYKLLDLAAA